jgi:hypothetical protein
MSHETESFERGPELARAELVLPADTYNLSRILLAASRAGCVFVPMRGMQYLAVVDAEEIIFVDSQFKRWVEVAWRWFQPQARAALDAPVTYQAVYYTPDGAVTQRRLQGEFHAALALLAARRPSGAPARVLAMPRGQNESES